jgi:hypothetical protein
MDIIVICRICFYIKGEGEKKGVGFELVGNNIVYVLYSLRYAQSRINLS